MSDENLGQRSGCGPRLVWVAKAVFILLLVAGGLLALVWGGFTIYQMIQTEIERSADSVTTRFNAQESRIDVLREEVNGLVAANPGQEEAITQLRQDLTAVSTQLNALDADLSQQNDTLVALEAAMATTLSNDDTAASSIETLNDNLSALQNDFNDASVRLDTFGGEVDSLAGDVALLDETAGVAQETATESETAVDEMAQTLVLFRAWELVARARLRLLENNLGLAETDIADANQTLQFAILGLPEASTEREGLRSVQTRLTLATDNLDIDATLASADLEGAWDELDKILTLRLQPMIDELELGLGDLQETPVALDVELTATPVPTVSATIAITTTIEASATPSP